MIIKEAGKLVKLILFILIIFLNIMLLQLQDKLVNCGSVDHCYSDIGCFPLSAEFYHPRHRPFNVRPWHRKRIKTRFELYNRRHPEGFILKPWDSSNLFHSNFNPNLETKIIVPGWLDNIRRALWVKQMKDAFLWLWKPCNIIVVHWRNFTPYTIATANTRVVGAELANLLKFIEHEHNYNRLYYHIIGHSLGAHIGGYCGDRLAGLGRITALDPARPFFQHMPKSVRLDRGDARFVDAIHSDFTPENAIFLFMSFGMTTPVGHVDFYPNGPPLLQSGCLRDTILSVPRGIQKGLQHNSLPIAFLESIRYLTACDHQRAHQWFIESITNRQCLFVGVRCNEYEGLINGRCTCDDSRSACAIMGIHADQMYINGAHDDLWPYKKPFLHQSNLREGPQLNQNNIDNNIQKNKQQIYNGLRYKAFELRNPPVILLDLPKTLVEEEGLLSFDVGAEREKRTLPTSFKQSENDNKLFRIEDISQHKLIDEVPFKDYENEINIDEQIKNDLIFHNYLTSILTQLNGNNNNNENDYVFKKRQSTGSKDDDLGLLSFLSFDDSTNPNGHPKLMSELDRNIENWYEETSRWYLKTNNKQNFCVNQYQVLVFIGPLRTSNGREDIRANLILSIIGTRGQITNQRFKPRSALLDSYTMQPFFILLEGSYSLGEIISVAVGWENRIDLDPIQATISFESNLLENIEPLLPAYKAKHPWISETMKYDYSRSFDWKNRGFSLAKSNPLLSSSSIPAFKSMHYGQQEQRLARRDGLIKPSNNSISFSNTNLPSKYSIGGMELLEKRLDVERVYNHTKPLALYDNNYLYSLREKSSLLPESVLNVDQLKLNRRTNNNNIERNKNPKKIILNQINKSSKFDLKKDQIRSRQDYYRYKTLLDLDNSEMNILPQTIHKITDNNVVAKFHNIGIHMDRHIVDSIVINKVIVSPLQADYGKSGRVRKIFCPPRENYRLKRDQTVHLQQSITSKCNYHYYGHHFNRKPLMYDRNPVRVIY